MKISSRALLKACTLSVALLGSAAIVTAIAVPDVAFAKSVSSGDAPSGFVELMPVQASGRIHKLRPSRFDCLR